MRSLFGNDRSCDLEDFLQILQLHALDCIGHVTPGAVLVKIIGEGEIEVGQVLPLDHDVLLAWLCDDREDSVSNRAIVDWLGDIFCWGLATYGLRNCSDLDDFPTEGGHFDVQDGAFPPHIASDWAVVHFRVDFLEWHWFVVFVKDLQAIGCCESQRPVIECAFDFDGAFECPWVWVEQDDGDLFRCISFGFWNRDIDFRGE